MSGSTRRLPPEERRALVVAAAAPMLAEHGLVNTSMRQIADAAGISLGTLSYHFDGQAEVLAEVLERELAWFTGPVVAALDDDADVRTVLHGLVDRLFADTQESWQHWRLWLQFWSLAAHDPAYANRQEEVYGRWAGDLTTLMRRGQLDGSWQVQELGAAVSEFMALSDGLAVHAFLPGQGLQVGQARQVLHAWVDRVPRGDAPR